MFRSLLGKACFCLCYKLFRPGMGYTVSAATFKLRRGLVCFSSLFFVCGGNGTVYCIQYSEFA